MKVVRLLITDRCPGDSSLIRAVSREVFFFLLVYMVCQPAVTAEQFRFGWDANQRADVKAASRKKGDESTVRYTVALETLPEGDHALHIYDFKFLTLNGIDATQPEIAARLGPLATLTSKLPTMHISENGEFLGTHGLDEMRQRLLESLGEEITPQMREQLKRYFESPKLQAVMQQRSGEMWNVWVGAWNGLDLAAGQEINASVPVAIVGQSLLQQVHVEHVGSATEYCDTCVRVRMTTLIEGPEVIQLVQSLVAEASQQGGETIGDSFQTARSFGVTEVVVEPSSLRPQYARMKREVALVSKAGEERTQQEEKEFWFSWYQ